VSETVNRLPLTRTGFLRFLAMSSSVTKCHHHRQANKLAIVRASQRT
jgi:hypothetical protein